MGTVLPALPVHRPLYVTVRRDELRQLKTEHEQLKRKSLRLPNADAQLAAVTVTASLTLTPDSSLESASPSGLPCFRPALLPSPVNPRRTRQVR
jgi:hypothetical protein